MKHVDVVVVGGGMVGSLLALNLVQRYQRSVLMIEAQPMNPSDGAMSSLSFDGRSTALSRTTSLHLQHLGLWSEVMRHAAPIRSIHVTQQGSWGRFRLDAQQEGVDAFGYVIENAGFGAVLSRAVAACPDIEVWAPCRVEQVDIQGGTTTVHVPGRASVQTGLMVAADGAFSRLRSVLGIRVERHDYGQNAIVCNIQLTHAPQGLALERFSGDEVLAVLPRIDGSHALIWTAPTRRAEVLAVMPSERFRAELQLRLGPGMGRVRDRTDPVVYPLERIVADQQVQPGRVILGNAAHFLHPVAGQGFNLCVRDVLGLTQIVDEQARLGQPLGEISALERYASSRIRDQQMITGFSDSLVRFFTWNQPGLMHLRSLGLAGLDLVPASKKILARMTMGAV